MLLLPDFSSVEIPVDDSARAALGDCAGVAILSGVLDDALAPRAWLHLAIFQLVVGLHIFPVYCRLE